MNIEKDGENLIVRIPLTQRRFNPYEEMFHGDGDTGEMPALVGMIAGREYTLSDRIDMDYKDKDDQEGSPILYFDSREELEEVCKKYGIDIWEFPLCAYCGKAIRGTFGFGEKGNRCYDCGLKPENPKS